jgi:hypothetical protein
MLKNTPEIRKLFRECLGVTGARLAYAMASAMQYRDLATFLRKAHPEYFVTDAFNWNNSHEGYEFWNAIDREWQKYVNVIEIENRRAE